MIPLSNMGATWNASTESVNTAIGMNVTDIQSAANSRLLSLKVDDVDRFYITKDGTVNYSNAVVTTTISDTITSNNITSNNVISDDITSNTISANIIISDSITANTMIFNGAIDEKVHALTDAATIDINPDNGTIQYLSALGASRTITTSNISEGESVTLMLNDNSDTGSVSTWTSVSWINNGGIAPEWPADGVWVVVVLWNVNGTVYGAVAGTGA